MIHAIIIMIASPISSQCFLYFSHFGILNKRISNIINFKNFRCWSEYKSQMTELVLSCPRFMRNLTGQCASLVLCLPRTPVLAIHWSAIGLGDTGWHCLTLRVTHWAKPSRGQAGQLLDNQFVPF